MSAKFGTAVNGIREIPRNGGDRMGDSSRMGGGDRMGGSGDRYPPPYDRGGYQTGRDERGYGGGGGYDRPPPIYREERGRDRDREGLRELSREIPRYGTRGRSPPPLYYDDRSGGGMGGSYDDRCATLSDQFLYVVIDNNSNQLSILCAYFQTRSSSREQREER